MTAERWVVLLDRTNFFKGDVSSHFVGCQISAFKLAAGSERRGLLGPLRPEPADSGIDSDDTEPGRRGQRGRRRNERAHMSDTSSADDEVVIKAPWVRAVRKKHNEQLRTMDDDLLDTPEAQMISFENTPPQYPSRDADPENSSGRSSPPLYEVELTASDEDDDGSVLELVIPVQLNSRYQRVPTSSPNKMKPPTFRGVFRVLCCFRK